MPTTQTPRREKLSHPTGTAAASMAGLDRSNFRRLLMQFSVRPKRSSQVEPLEPVAMIGDADDDGDDALDVA